MKSLADHLGVQDPRPGAERREDSSAKPPSLMATNVAEFCREFLNSKEYRDSLLRRVIIDDLPPAIESLIWHYACGKPVDKLEVKDTTTQLEDLTPEQLEERAVFLVECARKLRTNEPDLSTPAEESVH